MKIQKKILIITLLCCVSCIPYFGPSSKYGFGADKNHKYQYKYRCEKPGDCCEVGKDCKENPEEDKNIKPQMEDKKKDL